MIITRYTHIAGQASFQAELLSFVASIDAKMLGMWVVKGWNEILTNGTAKSQFRDLLTSGHRRTGTRY